MRPRGDTAGPRPSRPGDATPVLPGRASSFSRATHLLQPGGDGPRLALGLGLDGATFGDAEHADRLGRPAPALPHGGGTATAGDVTPARRGSRQSQNHRM